MNFDINYRDVVKSQKEFELKYLLNKTYIGRDIPPIQWNNEVIKVVIGPRRCGKSHFSVKSLESFRSPESFCYANFDSFMLTKIENTANFIEILKEEYGESSYFLFDEIQNFDNWEDFIGLLHRRGARILITGSNSKLLSGELATKLTGRYVQVFIFPFNFKEYLKAKGIDREKLPSASILTHFNAYLKIGGFPEVILTDIDPIRYLRDLFDAVLYKDIRVRHEIRKPKLMEDFTYFLISNACQELSYNKTAKSLGCSIDVLIQYFQYLKDAFIFFEIPRYSHKVRNQITYNKKIYCIDNGFIQAKSFRLVENEDILYENLVALTLFERCFDTREEIYYWKHESEKEIDFIVKKGANIDKLIQVSFNIESQTTLDRECRALVIGSRELECDDLILLTENKSLELTYEWQNEKKKIKIIPLYLWLTGLENSAKY